MVATVDVNASREGGIWRTCTAQDFDWWKFGTK